MDAVPGMGFLLRQLFTIALIVLVTASTGRAATDSADRRTAIRSFDAQVVRVVNGDMLDARLDSGAEVRVRLAGIDAPERKQSQHKEAMRHLSDLVLNKTVTVEVLTEFEMEGRLQARVTSDGVDVGFEQVRNGYAMLYRDLQRNVDLTLDLSAKDVSEYEYAQMFALQGKRGVWSEPDVTPPWVWRKTFW